MTQRFLVRPCLRIMVASAVILSAGAARAEVLTVDNVLTLNGIEAFFTPLADGHRVLNRSDARAVTTVQSLPRTQDEAGGVSNSTVVFDNTRQENTSSRNTPFDFMSVDIASPRGLQDAVSQGWLGLALLYEESIPTQNDDGLFYVANFLGVDQVRFEGLGVPAPAPLGDPVAEPPTLILLGTAMVLALARRWRKAHQAQEA